MKKADILITILVVAMGIGLLIYNTSTLTDEGAIAKIYVDGQLYKEMPLDTDASITVETERGMNVIFVEDGHVFIQDSDCQDQLCVHMPAISVSGQNIVCLPHHLHIEIEGGFDGEVDVDVISH